MNNEKKTLLFLVDDDALFLKTLEVEFASMQIFPLRHSQPGNFVLKIFHKILMLLF